MLGIPVLLTHVLLIHSFDWLWLINLRQASVFVLVMAHPCGSIGRYSYVKLSLYRLHLVVCLF